MEDKKSKFLPASEFMMWVESAEDNALFFLNGHPQAQWATYDNVRPVKFREQANTLPRQFQAYPKVVVWVFLEGFDVVTGICIRFCRGKFVHDTLWEPKLLSEASHILYLERWRRSVSSDRF
jgi:hypothetical protein